MGSTCEEPALLGSMAILGVQPPWGPWEWALPLAVPADLLGLWLLNH